MNIHLLNAEIERTKPPFRFTPFVLTEDCDEIIGAVNDRPIRVTAQEIGSGNPDTIWRLVRAKIQNAIDDEYWLVEQYERLMSRL